MFKLIRELSSYIKKRTVNVVIVKVFDKYVVSVNENVNIKRDMRERNFFSKQKLENVPF